jgi:hypothetical protein
MSRARFTLVALIVGLLAIIAGITLVDRERAPQNRVGDGPPVPIAAVVEVLPVPKPDGGDLFVEDLPVPTAGEDPPPPLPDRAIARFGPVKDALLSGELEFSPDGQLLVVGAKSGLQIWNVQKKKLVRMVRDVHRARFSPDGKTLAAVHFQQLDFRDQGTCELVLWQLASGKEIHRYPVPSGWIHHLNFLENNKLMYVGNKGIHTLDLESGAHTLVYNTAYFDVFNLDFSPKTMTVAYVPCGTVGDGCPPYLFDCRSQKTNKLNAETFNAPTVRLSPDGKIVAVMGGGTRLQLFDAETAKTLPVPETSSVETCVFSPDGKRIAWLCAHDKLIHYFDIATSKHAPSFEEPFSGSKGIVYSPDGNIIASTLHDNSIVLWDLTAKPSDKDMAGAQREQRMALVRTRVTIAAEKKQYVIGERIYIDHITENVGKVSYEYHKGGDYRGADRHLSYYIEAIHEDGTAMPDPNPNQMCFGGMGSTITLKPGDKDTMKLELLAYRRLDRPGKYQISAGKGSVATTIEILAATPEQAKKLVDEMDAKHKDDSREIREYARLTNPVYLPLMTERARAGSFSALLALGQTPDPQATKVLIELLDHPDPKFVYAVQEALYLRMPDPILDKKLHARNFFDNDSVEPRIYLRDKSWRPEFAEPVRKHAIKCLAKRDEASLFRGAFMLSCVGTAEDLPDFIAAFDFAVKDAQGKPIQGGRYPRSPGACGELRRAAQMLVDRSVPVADKPKTSGEKILFVEKISRDQNFRPEGWETTFVSILKDEMDYVREVAVGCCPTPSSDAFKKVIAERMRDSHVDVQIAALRLVEKNPLPEWKPTVLEVFDKAEEEWLRNAVGNAAYYLCDRLECVEHYVGLIDDPKKAKKAVEELTFILRDGGSKSLGTDVETPEKRQKCKAAWVKFVAENREKLKQKEPFSLKDPIPIDDLFPGIKFYDRK